MMKNQIRIIHLLKIMIYHLSNQNESINNLKLKISHLEQKAMNRFVVLQGVKVDSIVREGVSKEDSPENILKNHLKAIIPRDDLSIIVSIKAVKIYGQHMKFLRIELESDPVKTEFIVCLKKLRPDGIYVSEFLIQEKLKLFHQVRIFAKANRNKIEQVFTRNGNIFIRTQTQRR